MLLMAAGGLLVVLVCVDMGIKQYIEENFEEEEERETILDKVVLRKVYNKGFCFNTQKIRHGISDSRCNQ